MNIGMFPMSGIRVCDTELLDLGLTLPGFVERSKTIASLPSLGLLTLAGMTPSHHNIHYQEVPTPEKLVNLPQDLDLVAISTYSAQINEAYELAQRFKAIGTPTVIGGTHVTALPEEASKYCDAVAIGEGEPIWPSILRDAENGNLQQFYRSDGNYNLADAPMPAFELIDITKYNRITVQTSRGCPHHCEFCASSVVLTNQYKQKPIEKVLKEIEHICRIWKHPFIEFADDNSFVNHTYWKELLKPLRNKGLKWFAETDISVADDPALLTLMRESGCAQVLIGLESPEKDILQGVELCNNWKLNKFSAYKEAIRTIQSHGITVNGCFIIGMDGQTTDIFDKVLEFAADTELYEVQITIMTPFPGTPLYERLSHENRLLEPENWKKCTLFDLNFKPDQMTEKELCDGFKTLTTKLYSEELTNWRRNRFRQNLRARRKTVEKQK